MSAGLSEVILGQESCPSDLVGLILANTAVLRAQTSDLESIRSGFDSQLYHSVTLLL